MITDREDSIGIQIDRTVLSVRDAMDGMTEDRVVSSIWVGLGSILSAQDLFSNGTEIILIFLRCCTVAEKTDITCITTPKAGSVAHCPVIEVSTNSSVGKRNKSYLISCFCNSS